MLTGAGRSAKLCRSRQTPEKEEAMSTPIVRTALRRADVQPA
jgi:hypothetical protein